MKQQLDKLTERAMGLIKNPSFTDPTLIARLAPIPSKVQRLRQQLTEIEGETSQMESLLDIIEQSLQPSRNPIEDDSVLDSIFRKGRREQTKLRIHVDAKFMGGKPQTICARGASDSLAQFLTLLYGLRGIPILDKLSTYKVNRAPFVSRNPQKDFAYQNDSGVKVYANQPVGDSGFYVFTNSMTQEKAEAIQGLWAFLGFPRGAMTVEVIGKNE